MTQVPDLITMQIVGSVGKIVLSLRNPRGHATRHGKKTNTSVLEIRQHGVCPNTRAKISTPEGLEPSIFRDCYHL